MGAPEQFLRPFEFDKDTFTFVNELVWQYHFDPKTGAMSVSNNNPPPTYSHRCFVIVRTARQFFYHARFEPTLPVAEAEVYRRLIRQVVARNPRRGCAPEARISIPGYPCLRAFSQANEPLLKTGCGGPWQSYFLRSHWRMVFPVWGAHQDQIARQLQAALARGATPLVHLFRFPRITINHGLLVFAMAESKEGLEFNAYDPNISAHPVKLIYHREAKAFHFPPAIYWAGGPVSVIEIFRGGLY